MDPLKRQAETHLRTFKGGCYRFGLDVFGTLGEFAAEFGRKAVVITSGIGREWGPPIHDQTRKALARTGVKIIGGLIPGTAPNSPLDETVKLAETIKQAAPDVVVAVGGGSVIDAAKAAIAYAVFGDIAPDLHDYFGVSTVSRLAHTHGRAMIPLVAVQLAAGSGAHLTKYSNITDTMTGQKKLIIDSAMVPPRAVFDYQMTRTMSTEFTLDGALDGTAHCLEAYYGITADQEAALAPVALTGIELIVRNVTAARQDPGNMDAREALGLGTDLGGYAIMIGGTNGAHLNSFSFVDLMPHGRACALMNPYYTVFFAPAVEHKLKRILNIYIQAGYADASSAALSGRDLGMAAAEAMLRQSRELGFPTTLSQVEGFSADYIPKALRAAKNPALKSKLQNMPVPLTPELVDDYMGPILAAAEKGDLSLIKTF